MRHSAYLSAATILLLGLISVYGKGFAAGNVDRGRDIYINAGCGHCHGTYGQGGGNYGGAGPKLAPNPLDYEVIQLQIRTPGQPPILSPDWLGGNLCISGLKKAAAAAWVAQAALFKLANGAGGL